MTPLQPPLIVLDVTRAMICAVSAPLITTPVLVVAELGEMVELFTVTSCVGLPGSVEPTWIWSPLLAGKVEDWTFTFWVPPLPVTFRPSSPLVVFVFENVVLVA